MAEENHPKGHRAEQMAGCTGTQASREKTPVITDQYPILVFVYDETMTGTWGDEAGNTTECTLTETDEEDCTAVMTATFEDATTIDLVYSADDDAFIYTSEDEGYMCVLTNVDGIVEDTTEDTAEETAEDTAAYTAKSNTLSPWPVDRYLYKERSLVENFFLKIKEFRRVAMHYDWYSESML